MSKDQNWEKLLDHLESEQQKGNILTSEEKQNLEELRMLMSETSDAFQLYQSFDVDQKWNKLRAEGVSRGLAHAEPVVKQKTFRLQARFAIAAAIATVLVFAGLFYYNFDVRRALLTEIAYKNDVAPGKTGATLTLANGKKIRLDQALNGELAKEAGVVISKSADGQLIYEVKGSAADPGRMNTLTTAKGESYQLRLPDGSLVWLNAASSLTYAADLNSGGKRKVELDGEAYFEIAKDKAHPFVVESRKQEVEVLGTHFNVNAYADEPVVATTLLEGAVKVTGKGLDQTIRPGEQAINNGSAIQVMDVDVETVVDWKSGGFILDRVDFRTVMRKIARWYNVEVVYDPTVPYDMISGGYISRSMQLSSVLKLIEKSGQVRFRIEGRTVHVSE
ncbi:FecR family protein [Pedobacter nyackensis]|uniref:FecR family protein n=1 Tax=Pedobacter nyackensis TaxID=475255 RepID=UPI00292CDDED|nr:FecR domain-containing protein [Pedobacter nyackensis]